MMRLVVVEWRGPDKYDSVCSEIFTDPRRYQDHLRHLRIKGTPYYTRNANHRHYQGKHESNLWRHW